MRKTRRVRSYKLFAALEPFFDIVQQCLADHVDGDHHLDTIADNALFEYRSQDACVVILEYEVHGRIVRTGASYDNRFISVVTIEDRKIVQWRDYMDSLTAMTALGQT